MFRRFLLHFYLVIALVISSACGHYRLGTSGQLTFSTLYVAPIAMKALIPQSQPIFDTKIRDSFSGDGRVTLENQANLADATLSITILDYKRDIATVRPGDTGLARKFLITITAEATLVERTSGRELFSRRKIVAKRDAYTDGGQQQAEYQLLPLLAQELADKAAHAVLDTW